MRTRALLAACLVLAALAGFVAPAAAAPTCFGKPATHVMQAGDPPYGGTGGGDVVVGSAGADLINLAGSGGTDLACGGGGMDDVFVAGPGSKADGGAGADRVGATSGGLARGGSGDDRVATAVGAIADGGSGADDISGLNSAALYGGSGRDAVTNFGGNPRIDCGAAYDTFSPNGATDVRRCENVVAINP